MRLNEQHKVYEYIAVYVEDLAIAAKDCKKIIDILTDKYKFKLKGTGTISYHLGMVSSATTTVLFVWHHENTSIKSAIS